MSADGGTQPTALALDGLVAVTPDDGQTYIVLQQSAAFARLRSRSRRYLGLMTALFLGALTAVVTIARWMPQFLAARVFGDVNLATLLAVGLILVPFVIAAVHMLYAGRRLDPLAKAVRLEFERSRQ